MPTLLPNRTRAEPKRRPVRQSPEGLEIWALIIGLGAVALASFVYFTSGDQFATAAILILTAVVVAAIWRGSFDDLANGL